MAPTAQAALFSAPGRTEIGGNHTDHQRGRVLAGSVNLDVIAAVAPSGDRTIRIQSEGFPMDVVDLDDLSVREEERNTSAAIIRGIAACLPSTVVRFRASMPTRLPTCSKARPEFQCCLRGAGGQYHQQPLQRGQV